jgi:hypothetical protein
MPYSSMEIAQMNGAFQQASMQQQQYSGMIGQGYGGGSIYGGGGAMGDRIAGGAMSRAGAVGAPLMAGAAGLMGMDPMSLGLKAGIGAYGAGAGLGGAAMAGVGVALPAMAAFSAASYGGHQIMEGANQQAGLNNTLRSSYNFMNRGGGSGFQRGEMTQIGEMVRGMSENFGPGGEVTGFRELTNLAGKMGQMGFAQGVRDVKEFSTRFKEMVASLKTMAKDLNTTLEGAMEFAAAAKQSGVFGMRGMQQFTHAVIGGAAATGLAVSEFTGMASIGSQISRSVGGLGRQGAGAGVTTMNQIGMALKTGVLSEEDIYNATGLTGAEGRQAYASSQLQRAGSFYQSGRGRRMLASIAGKNGQLDEVGVQELLAGGMGISETMSRDNKMKSSVGRANFIRNEGHLRGAAMERLGGLGPVMQMKQWMESKGLDLSIDNDRSSLFLQRQMGLGRDEADDMMKQMQNLPQQLADLRVSGENKSLSDEIGQRNKQRGIEGIKGRFEQAKTVVNNKFQKIGADIFEQGSRALEEFFMHLSGQYTEAMNTRADAAYRSFMSGNQGAFNRTFGAGGGGLMMKRSAGTWDEFTAGSGGASSRGGFFSQGPIEQAARFLFGGESMSSKYEKAGFSFAKVEAMESGAAQDKAMRARMNEISSMERSANGPVSADLVALGKQNAGWMNKFYAQSLGGVSGEDRMNKIVEEFGTRAAGGDKDAAAAYAKLKGASSVERARIIAGLEGGGGVTASAHLGKGGFLSAVFGDLGGAQETHEMYQRRMAEQLGITGRAAVGAGALLDSGDMRSLQRDLFSKDKSTRDAATKRALDSVNDLQAKGVEQTAGTAGQITVNKTALAAQEYEDKGGANITEADAQKILTGYGLKVDYTKEKGFLSDQVRLLTAKETLAKLHAAHTAGGGADQDVLDAARQAKPRARAELDSMSKMGIATYDEASGKVRISAATKESLSKINGGTRALMLAMSSLQAETQFSDTDVKTDRARMQNIEAKRMEESNFMAGMSDEDVKKMSIAGAGTDVGRRYAETAAGRGRITKGLQRGGAAGGIGAGLGLTLTDEEKKVFNAKDAKGREAYQAQMQQMEGLLEKELLGDKGTKDEDLKRKIQSYAGYMRSGDVKHGEETLKSIQGNEEVQKAARDKRNAQSEANEEPWQTAIKENSKKQADSLDKIAQRGIRVMNVDEFKKVQEAEAKDPPTQDKNAANSGK